MNPIKKHYIRMRYQERVNALKKAGIPVNQKTVYDESIHVGVPVPRFGKEKHTGRRQADHEVNKSAFTIDYIKTGIIGIARFIVRPKGRTVFGSKKNRNRRALSRKQLGMAVSINVIFIIIGSTMLYFGMQMMMRGLSCSGWPSVSGKILKSELLHMRGSTSGSRTSADIEYEYVVNDTWYCSSRVSYGDVSPYSTVKQYPVGAGVAVFFAPNNPKVSVLEAKYNAIDIYILPGLGLLFVVISLSQLISIVIRQNRAVRQSKR
jgi:hypothetical protein